MKPLEPFAAGYREEAAERIAELEEALLALDERPEEPALVDQAFRALHTIKGSGAMFGFDALAAFTHEVEGVFQAVRDGRAQVTRELVGLALQAKDLLRPLLEGAGDPAAAAALVAKLRAHLPAAAPATRGGATGQLGEAPPRAQTFRIRFEPHPDLFADGTNPLGLLSELRGLGRCEIVARPGALPPLEELDPERAYLGWDVELTTARGLAAVRDAFMFVEDRGALEVAEAGPEAAAPPPAEAPAETPVEAAPVEAAATAARATPVERARQEPAASIRVESAKLDGLVDLVGELVIAQARLARLAGQREDPELRTVSEEIDRLSTELRDRTLDVRMVPIGTTFARFRRLVRDLSAELGKEIALETEGAETELDKTVIERLGDPLVHLLRNACDHGIEAPEARRAAGKPARGTVRLSATHAGAGVVVELRDDGRGLDVRAIRAKAVERGLLAADAALSERELFDLVFLPGFSTATAVSSVSGRGVGMDVVKTAIEALRGTVSLDSTPGQGTTVTIQLPLTLAIIEGLLVSVGEGSYVLPLAAVEECVELSRADVERSHGAHLATVRGELVPYVRLREVFEVDGARPDLEQVAIVHHGEARCGLVVDGVVGQHQTVIKSMGRMYRDVDGLSGATILGDGRVALIIDVPALVDARARAAAR